MTIMTSRAPQKRRLVDVVSDMFSLGGENRPYPAASADEITREAWEHTGQSIQSGLDYMKNNPATWKHNA